MLLVMSTLLIVDITSVILGISFEIQYLDSEVDDLENVVDTCQDMLLNNTSVDLGECDDDDVGKKFYDVGERVAFWTSIVVLSLFLLESLVLLAAKPVVFFFDAGRMLDLAVVSVSLTLEIVFHRSTVGGLIVVARVWRFARIGAGVYNESSKDCETCQERGKLLHQLDSLNEDRAVLNAYESMLAGGDSDSLDTELLYNLLHVIGTNLAEKEEREKEMAGYIAPTPMSSSTTKSSAGDVYTRM